MLADLRRDALKALRPPPRIDLADWVSANVFLPSSLAAHPGRMRLWPHQVEIARSMGARDVERVSILKSARIGYTQLGVAALGNFVANDPGPILVVLPAEQDCRDLMVGNVEPTFAESPALRAALSSTASDRDTLFSRRFPGGSLKLVSARAPRNLRGHTARVLFLDEVDAFEVDVRGEGDPVALAERRTTTFSNRKIIMGSTPVHEQTSRIVRAYERSDRRVYECACPACGERHELRWKDIRWPDDAPGRAFWSCPGCGGVVEDADKATFVSGGRWRPTASHVKGHHGYRVSALVSLLPNASWGRLAGEFLEAKKSPQTLQTFVNTVLGEAWRDDGEELDEGALAGRAEGFGLDELPPEVLVVTAGVDVQDDRIEITTVGWTKDGAALALGHGVVWGSPLDEETWREVDDHLRRTWKHPNGGLLRVDAAIVDSGSGGHTDAVYAFCRPRTSRRVFAGKGVPGFARPMAEVSKARALRLVLVGVDAIKSQIVNRLQSGTSIRFSAGLSATWFEQLASEKRVVRYTRGQPFRAFERIPGRRSEALDCLVYAFAARQMVGVDPGRRENELSSEAMPAERLTVIKSAWLSNSKFSIRY
ncbi:phage terminase large subunit family protein [Hansschlegelia plantiphila]|uniref:Terminase n=1 Tax=Hansschlegelia plantiphila TaxID=374655 RepID=A0A9W6IZN8_9HYPH|nr:phage terminase large subunit family protein [Hansschlegelia plantiphila]GLK67038.1 terminase [Hansschlegelia plantiphila]